MNQFDAAVLIVVLILAIMGFRAGLLRSLADILGFVIAAPLAAAQGLKSLPPDTAEYIDRLKRERGL
jgi:uncharacterized membrane protein required for colicin V production